MSRTIRDIRNSIHVHYNQLDKGTCSGLVAEYVKTVLMNDIKELKEITDRLPKRN